MPTVTKATARKTANPHTTALGSLINLFPLVAIAYRVMPLGIEPSSAGKFNSQNLNSFFQAVMHV